MTPQTAGIVFLFLSLAILAGTVAGAAFVGLALARAWVRYGIEYQKMFLKRDEDDRRNYETAITLMRESAEASHRRYLETIREITTPPHIRAMAEIHAESASAHRTAEAAERLATQVHQNLQPVHDGRSPLPMDLFDGPRLRPPVSVETGNGVAR